MTRADEILPGPNKYPGRFMLKRQIQSQAMKSIHRLESRSAESMDRHGHGCEVLDAVIPTPHFWQVLAEMISGLWDHLATDLIRARRGYWYSLVDIDWVLNYLLLYSS